MSTIEGLITKLLNGDTADFTPWSRVEAYLKAAINDEGTDNLPTPQSRLDALLYKLAENGGSTGGDTPSGSFKKKFMSFFSETSGALMNMCNAWTVMNGVTAYDEGILSTKTHDGIKVSFSPTDPAIYFYFIEDENNLFLYGDPTESGNNDWIPVEFIYNGEISFKGTITYPFAVNEPGVYIFFYYSEAQGE